MEPLEIAAVVIIMIIFFLFHYWMIRERVNVKKSYYERAAISHVCCPGNPVLDRWTQAPQKALTTQESKAHEILSKVSTDTMWGEAIRITLLRRDNNAFRELISQLYTEGIANPSGMINIIGADGWLAVCRCKECSYYN